MSMKSEDYHAYPYYRKHPLIISKLELFRCIKFGKVQLVGVPRETR